MARIFGVLLIVLGVWVGMEIYTKGMHDAFGGALARFDEPIHPGPSTSYDENGQRGSLAQRVGAKVKSDIKAGERRDDPDSGDDEDDN
jgi:hypothetical protein